MIPVIAPATPPITPPPLALPAIYAATIGETKENELPKNTGDLALVHNIYISVPIPAVTKATAIDKASPSTPAAKIAAFTEIGTSTVAPNIANTCCNAKIIHSQTGGLSLTS